MLDDEGLVVGLVELCLDFFSCALGFVADDEGVWVAVAGAGQTGSFTLSAAFGFEIALDREVLILVGLQGRGMGPERVEKKGMCVVAVQKWWGTREHARAASSACRADNILMVCRETPLTMRRGRLSGSLEEKCLDSQ